MSEALIWGLAHLLVLSVEITSHLFLPFPFHEDDDVAQHTINFYSQLLMSLFLLSKILTAQSYYRLI